MRKSTGWKLAFIFLAVTLNPVSYTHLDVYKRQRQYQMLSFLFAQI